MVVKSVYGNNMILELDCGNTRVKWRLLSASDGVVARGSLTPKQDVCKSLPVPAAKIKACRIASVWQEQAITEYAESIASQGVAVYLVHSSAELAGVRNSYRQPEKLGVDRWLAVVAAYDRYQSACLVLDFGTAVTADFVDNQGTYRGGVIAPGLELMRSTLMQKAQRLNVALDGENPDLLMPQVTTAAGIEAGVRQMMKGFIAQQLLVAEQTFTANFKLIVVGGDAELLTELGFDAIQEADLVFLGMALACPL